MRLLLGGIALALEHENGVFDVQLRTPRRGLDISDGLACSIVGIFEKKTQQAQTTEMTDSLRSSRIRHIFLGKIRPQLS